MDPIGPAHHALSCSHTSSPPPAAAPAPVILCPQVSSQSRILPHNPPGDPEKPGSCCQGPPEGWGSWPHVPVLMDAVVVFSLDGASGWMLARLSSLLEVPRSQHHMERGMRSHAEPLAPQGSSMERRAFVKRGGEAVSMTNVLAHANSEEDVNEVFTEVLEAMDSNEIGEKITLLQSQLPLVQEEPDRGRSRTVLETLLPTNIPAAMR